MGPLACRVTGNRLSLREDVRQAMAGHSHRVAVIGGSERTTAIPEYADLYAVFPNEDWDAYRALGATRVRPVTSSSEENFLCPPGDVYPGDSALVEMLAHGLRDLGVVEADSQFPSRVQATYASAVAQNLWANPSAAKDAKSYGAVKWGFSTDWRPLGHSRTCEWHDHAHPSPRFCWALV
jgi:hypothetical protein